jgi:hypothetical protein
LKTSNYKSVEDKYTVTLIILLALVITTGVYHGPSHTVFTHDALGQEEDSEENSEDGSEENSEEEGIPSTPPSTSTEGILAYIDSQGRFRIGYPADAIIMPLEGLPGGVVSINSPGAQNITSIDLRITDLEDDDIDLEEHVTSVLAGLENSSISNFKPIQTAECEKYTLAGEQVCSFTYSGDIRTKNDSVLSNGTVMQLYSLLDENLYNIAYSASGVDFNNNLRILESMLNSFETLDGSEDLRPIPRFDNFTA